MESFEQRMDEEQLRQVPTGELVRHAIEETRLLVKAEVLHAKKELRGELAAAKVAMILLGSAAVLGLCALSTLLVALALALPLAAPLGAVVVGGGVLVIAAALAGLGVTRVPKRPLPKTQERLKKDLSLAREQLI